MTEQSPWLGSTGLADDFDGTIREVDFTYDSEYGDGKIMIAKITVDGDGGEEEELKLSPGKGWEPDQKGRATRREDGGDPKPFNRQSAYGRFVMKAYEVGAGEVLDDRGVPWEAECLEGLRFHFMREEYTPMQWDQETADKEGRSKPSRLMPENFLGVNSDGGEKPAAKKAAPAKKAPAKKTAEPEGDDEGVELPVKIKVKLKKLAQGADSHEEFVEQAYTDLEEAEEYEEIIMDDSEDGFYEQARA